jgi:hypothetical protein
MAKKASGSEKPDSSKKAARAPPFETDSLRKELRAFMQTKYPDQSGTHHIGWFKWGVYIFYDYGQRADLCWANKRTSQWPHQSALD